MGLMEMVLGIWSVSLKSKIIALDYGEKREIKYSQGVEGSL